MENLTQWVAGEPYIGSPEKYADVENPATGTVENRIALASEEDLNHVVAVAQKAQKEWAKTSLAQRVAIMFNMRQLVLDHQDDIARAIVAEHGKDYSDAIGEIQRGRETLDSHAPSTRLSKVTTPSTYHAG